MEKRSGFKMGEDDLFLLGDEIKIGDKAPDFKTANRDMSEFNLSDIDATVKLLVAVPSLDTKVCELETIRFNQEADKLDDVRIVTISMDLPFAQERFCGQNGIDNIDVVSDYKYRDFGKKYGVLIDDLFLLNRSIFVLDENNEVVYVEYVKQNTDHPDYDGALEAAKKALN